MRNTTALPTIIRGTAAPTWSVQPWQQHFAKEDEPDDNPPKDDENDDDDSDDDSDDDADPKDKGDKGKKPKGGDADDDDSDDELAVWKRNSRKHEKAFKTTDAQLRAVKKALGLKDGDKLDPDQLEEALGNTKAENAKLKMEVKVTKFAGEHADTLLDSKRFTDQLSSLDTESDSYDKDLKKLVEAEVKARNLGKSRGSSKGGTQLDAPDNKGSISREDLKKMSPKEIEKARKDGRLNDLLAGKV